MARHSRNIDNNDGLMASGGLRTRITFQRLDLLIKTHAVDPVTGDEVSLPRNGHSNQSAVGPNIQDLVVRDTKIVEHDGEKIAEVIWMLRDLSEIFLPKAARIKDKPDDILKTQFTAGGKVITEDSQYVWLDKPSSISISTLTLKLAEAMEGGFEAARYRVSDLAAEAWKVDIGRAKDLYELISSSKNQEVSDNKIPQILKAKSTISQEVESKILKSACLWFGVDPDSPLPKQKRGKRAKRTARQYVSDDDLRKDIEAEHGEGEYIRITLKGEAVTGSIIKEIENHAKDTDLVGLSLISLVELLGTFNQIKAELDSEYLEAYLDAAWPNWQDRVSGATDERESTINEDPWEILGVSKESSKAEIKKAYHKAMMTIHPDRSGLSNYFAIKVGTAYKQILKEI